MDVLCRGIISASLIEQAPVGQQLQSLMTLVRQLQQEVCELRRENAELCQQVNELRCDVGYWKSMHARAVERNTRPKAELDEAQAEIRQLKAERFGKQSEKRSAIDRSNHLKDPEDQATPKKKRGQQPGRPAPKRRDYSHLPEREELVDCPRTPKSVTAVESRWKASATATPANKSKLKLPSIASHSP